MASSGKKGKKNKGTAISLQSFLSNGDVPLGTTQVSKSIRNVDGEDSDEGGNVLTVVCQLPTAPRANRIFDDNSIPQKPPFIAYLTNLPFDVKEDDIYEYFDSNNIRSVRLPREDGETGRGRGFGYVEFESRDDLIQCLSILDPTIKGRRIRIDVSNENEQYMRQRGTRKGYETNSIADGRDSTNWRCENIQKKESSNFGNSNKEQKYTSDVTNSPGSWRLRSPFNVNAPSTVEQVHVVHTEDKNNKSFERPKLILKPRTLPLPDITFQTNVEPKSVDIKVLKSMGKSAEKVFGSARPVDTIAKDLEIEERLSGIRLHKVIKKNEMDLNELTTKKNEKEGSMEHSWRRHQPNQEINKSQEKKMFRSDLRRDNRYKYQDKTESGKNISDGKIL